MNGMDAVVLLLQDKIGELLSIYGPLAHYFIDYSVKKQCKCLYGYLNIPIAVGTKGGSITTHPGYKYVTKLLASQISDIELKAKDIADVIVCAGLANNFAAIVRWQLKPYRKDILMNPGYTFFFILIENTYIFCSSHSFYTHKNIE